MDLLLIDQNGWTKTVKIEKAITRLGTASSNDIQLTSQEVAPVHLQLLYTPELPASCKLVNLASEVVVHGEDDDYPVPRLANIAIRDGDEIELGEYRIALKIPLKAEYLRKSNQIDAELAMPEAVMRPDLTTVGTLTIKNIGMQPDCQFRVILQGLPQDCYQIDPVPLLYPDAQEEVRIQLFHRKQYPSVGFHDLYFHITAPANYPGEELIIKQGIYVAPVFDQTLTIMDDLADPTPPIEVEVEVQEDPVLVAKPVKRPVPPKPVLKEPPPTPIEVERSVDPDLEKPERSEDSSSLDEAEATPTLVSPEPVQKEPVPESQAAGEENLSTETAESTEAPVEALEETEIRADVELPADSQPEPQPDPPETESPVQEEPQPEAAESAAQPTVEESLEIKEPELGMETVRSQKKPEKPKVKIVRKQFDEFWEEE